MLTETEKIVLIKDYWAWCGSPPDVDDRHMIYMAMAMPHSFIGKRSEVLKFFKSYKSAKQLIKAEEAAKHENPSDSSSH